MGPQCPECDAFGTLIEVCKAFALSRCPHCDSEWTWEISTLEVTGLTPIDWASMPKGRNYLYYGREEMDAFHDTVKLYILRLTILHMASIDLLGKAREEVKAERSNVHHLDTILDDLEAHRIKLVDEITGYDNPFRDGGSIKFTSNHGDALETWFDTLWKIPKRRKIEEGRQG